jgi:predicted RND superfamily exporter protein
MRFFDGTVIRHPRAVMAVVAIVFTVLAYHARDFRIDASSETLMLEHDADLAYARQVTERYGEPGYLLVAYAPREDLLADAVLERIASLRDALEQVPSVSSVLTILDLPLLESPPVPVKDLASGLRTLTDPGTDRELARRELQQSPLFHNLMVGPDLKTTALVITFEHDRRWDELRSRRDALRDKARSQGLTAAEAAAYEDVSAAFLAHRDQQRRKWHATIADIRAILDRYRADADVFLGGVEMIADDMLTFIRNDLKVFGTGVFVFLVLILRLLFRNWRWVVIPLICCSASALVMVGILGWCNWEVTVISSNFISLQLIVTMAVTIHLIVRYRELFRQDPEADQRTLIRQTVALMIKPCLFTTLTTVAGFASLVLSDIKPVITFGWMMIVGLVVSMVATFVLFPSVLMLIPRQKIPAPRGELFDLPFRLARFTDGHGKFILTVSVLILVLSAWGTSRLNVENAFIDYFKHSTEIYQGMKVIDQRLGGTTPLDVVMTLARDGSETTADADPAPDEAFDAFAEFDQAADDPKYWFTRERMQTVEAVHDYLDRLPETGKVLSLATLVKIARRLNDGRPLDNFTLALLFGELPPRVRQILVDPYVSVENDETRLAVRIIDSLPGLRRNALLARIESDLVEKVGLSPGTFRLSGMMVLYNNMLQSLFQSQIMTLGVTVLLLMGMFLVLFRSLRIALIAIFPNVLSIGTVLGFIGWVGIPLDMMTITIAAISVGIAVDDTIHYIHRFRREFPEHGTYQATMHFCHGSIGRAMFYTSVVFVMGFSILVFSNFIPTIYFGLLTGLAMAIALVAALTLLPALIVAIRPFGPESSHRMANNGS